MVKWAKKSRGLAFWGTCIFSALSGNQPGAFLFSDTFAHIRYPVAVGVMGWLVGDESNKPAVNAHRIIEINRS